MNVDSFFGLLSLGFVAALVYVLVVNGSGTSSVVNSVGQAYSGAINSIEGR